MKIENLNQEKHAADAINTSTRNLLGIKQIEHGHY